MDTDIEFGEVEEESPRKNLRPDRNKHYAVAAYGTPVEGELPIFVDLDVIRDMEDHAQSDTSVELGGVLLGGHFEDDDGQPFVLVTDSLRAQHYESTKGSFKFTHDTWSAITRERDQFPEDLQMAGWYHTHPDWGVFLSGMDMFICDNFFNKKLDVAYVIDPCRGDRGMFQWTGEQRQRVRRTGGFYIVASRFRQAELEHYTALLQGNSAMPNLPHSGGYGSPVINVAPARSDPQPWHGPAVMGMLAMQFCLLALIAWKMVSPSEPARGDGNTPVAAKLDDLIRAERLKERMTTQTQVLDAVLANLKSTEPGFVEKLENQLDKTRDLALDVDTYRSQLAAQKHAEELTRAKLTSIERDLADTKESLSRRIKELQEQRDVLSQEKADARAELAVMKEKLNPKANADGKEDGGKLGGISYIWWLVGGSVVLLGAVAGVGIALRKPASAENVEAAKAAEERKEVRTETN